MKFISVFTVLLPALLVSINLSGQQRTDWPEPFSRREAKSVDANFSIRRFPQPLPPPEELLASGASSTHNHLPELRIRAKLTGADGRSYHRYRQYHHGIPVLGGELTFQLDERGRTRQWSGNLAAPTSLGPVLRLRSATTPAALPMNAPLPLAELSRRATTYLLADYPYAAAWTTLDRGESWTKTDPWSDHPLPYHRCRVIEVSEPAGSRAELVYLDAMTGKLVFRHPLHCQLNRRLHHRNTGFGNLVWTEGDLFPGNLSAEDTEMITATAEVYSLYYRTFGRWSYNGAGAQMRAVTQAAISGCPNARAYNGTVLACSGVVGDDIVGHEWTHNYTTALNSLIFRYESGSIQEAYADIFGEIVDLLNDRGLDAGDELHRSDCFDGNYRWCIAEDAVAIDTILRDVWAPECKTDPAHRNSPNFACPTPNGQDIHSNAALVSRTFALLVDGDTTATDTVRGIGLTKAAHLFYHANAHYVTRVTDFAALSAMLRSSALDLEGVNLRSLTLVNTVAPLSNLFITAADRASLDAALAATGLAEPAPCPHYPTLLPDPPPPCADAAVSNLVPLLQSSWEDSLAGWVVTETPVFPANWEPKPWRLTSGLPDGRPGTAMFAPNSHVGNCQSDRENGTVELTSPPVDLPIDEVDFRLRFDHYYSLEEGTDGGTVSMSRNGEAFFDIPASAFRHNGYDATLEPAVINDNPLAGRSAFTGADANSLTGSWGTTVVDLTAAGALPGDQVRLRWTLGHDGCDGWLGWYLDDVTVGHCGAAVLPVTYLSWTATGEKDHIRLDWATDREENNRGFAVERAETGGAFVRLSFVEGGRFSYRYADYDARPGVRYHYRLRQMDEDGSVWLSPLVSATRASEGALRVYPNPSDGTVWVSGDAAEAKVYDLTGRMVRTVRLEAGRTRLSGLRSGVYLIRSGEQSRRVVVR